MWTIAGAAFISIYFFKVPFPIIVIGAALIGYVGGKLWKDKFLVIKGHGKEKNSPSTVSIIDDESATPLHCAPSLSRALKVLFVCGLLWWLPVLSVGMMFGWEHTLFQEGLFFSKAALVTFGGAYAVLPYVSQQAVENYQWLTAGQMLDGLGLAETTPGPLIMVLQFVGFLGGWNQPGSLPPLAAATLGAFISTWTTFVPCFLFIFLGAPYIEQLRGKESLSTSLSAVTAAVVGVVLNLAVWFGVHVLRPAEETVDWFAALASVIAFVGMVKWKWDVIPVVLGGGALGLLFGFVTGGL
jgi:chromate transporter